MMQNSLPPRLMLGFGRLTKFRNEQYRDSKMSDHKHYLQAIRARLEQLYNEHPNDPTLREQLSDEVDWIDAKLATSDQNNGDWNAAIDAAAKVIEKYGLDRVNGMKDYPAAVASACVHHVRELKR